MDEYRSDSVLRHFHTRSTGLCRKNPYQLPLKSLNINFYVQYDHPHNRPESVGDSFMHVGNGHPPSVKNQIHAKRTAQTYLADDS